MSGIGFSCSGTADASVGGRRVLTRNGRSVANATITMTAPNGDVHKARTNYLGLCNFSEVESGQSYAFQINAKGLEFLLQIVTVNQTLTGLNFVARN